MREQGCIRQSPTNLMLRTNSDDMIPYRTDNVVLPEERVYRCAEAAMITATGMQLLDLGKSTPPQGLAACTAI